MIAEDLLLLITDDSTGRTAGTMGSIDYGLVGAVLCELTLLRRIRLTTESDFHHRKNRVVVESSAPTGNPILDDALSRLAGKDRSPNAAVRILKKGLRSALHGRLVQTGALREETRRLLGIFPTAAWPTADATRETELRRTLERVRFQGTAPEPRVDALIGCLSVVGMAHKVIPSTDPKAVKRAAKEARTRNWGARVARTAYDAAVAASAASS